MDRMDRQAVEAHRSGEWPNPYDEEIDALDKETVEDELARENARRENANAKALLTALFGEF